MIKKIYFSSIRIVLIIVVLVGYIGNPIMVGATTSVKSGDTLASLREQLKEWQNKKAQNDSSKKQTQSEIDANRAKIQEANASIESARSKVESITAEIENTNTEIENLKKETEDILVLYQQVSSDNFYINYISGASSITDLVMRIDAITRFTDYNKTKLNSLEMLIENNKKLQNQLSVYEEELNGKISAYEETLDSLSNDYADLIEGAEDIASEIEGLKELIKYYEDAGCKEDEDLTTCVDVANNSGWLKPLKRGVITSLFGWRKHPTTGVYKLHSGIDIGGNSEGTSVYSSTAGVVGKITRYSSCGGNMVYVWVYVNGTPYTVVYMHLLSINVAVGDSVNTQTVIGTVGGGSQAKAAAKAAGKSTDSCSTGAHLHYTVSANNHYLRTKSDTYSKYTANLINPPGFPGLGNWFTSR